MNMCLLGPKPFASSAYSRCQARFFRRRTDRRGGSERHSLLVCMLHRVHSRYSICMLEAIHLLNIFYVAILKVEQSKKSKLVMSSQFVCCSNLVSRMFSLRKTLSQEKVVHARQILGVLATHCIPLLFLEFSGHVVIV